MEILQFEIYGDERGSLISLEQYDNIPFDIKRVYYIFNTSPGVSRGFHAHKNLKQVIIAIHGKCDLYIDEGPGIQVVTLDSPSKGLFVDRFCWREMHNFSKDCVLVVLASELYDPSDYITDYDKFKRLSYVKTC